MLLTCVHISDCLPSNTYGEGPIFPVSILYDWHLSPKEASRTIQDLMGMSMVCGLVLGTVVATIVMAVKASFGKTSATSAQPAEA